MLASINEFVKEAEMMGFSGILKNLILSCNSYSLYLFACVSLVRLAAEQVSLFNTIPCFLPIS